MKCGLWWEDWLMNKRQEDLTWTRTPLLEKEAGGENEEHSQETETLLILIAGQD